MSAPPVPEPAGDQPAPLLDPASVLHILAGVSLGISIAMAPTPDTAGAASLLVVVALGALLDGLLARRAALRRATETGERSPEGLVTYSLLLLSLLAFFLMVRRLLVGGFGLWVSCAAFSLGMVAWRDFDDLRGVLLGDDEGLSRPRLVALGVGLLPAVYYLLYGLLNLPSAGLWGGSAALFHGAALVVRRLLEGPLKNLSLGPEERQVELLLRQVEREGLPGAPTKSLADGAPALLAAPAPAPTAPADVLDHAAAVLEPRDDSEDVDSGVLSRIEKGLAAWERGDEAGALDTFLGVVADRPDLEEPTLWAVQLVAKAGSPERARELLVQFLRRHPRSYAGFFQLGRILVELNSARLARRAWTKASLLDPAAAAPVRELARLSASEGRSAEAARLAKDVLARSPGDRWATEFLEELGSADRRRAVARLRDEARTLLAGRKRGEALRVLKEAAAADPGDTEARLRSARILLDGGSPDEAVALFEEALSLPFEGREGHELPVELARAYLAKGELPRARLELERSTAHFPLHLDLGFLRIETLLRQGDRVALERYVEAARDGAAEPERLLLAARVVLVGEAFDVPAGCDVDRTARELLDRAAAAGAPAAPYELPQRFEARLAELRARWAARRGDRDEALAFLERAVAADPTAADARAALGQLYMDRGVPGRAVTHFEVWARLRATEALPRRRLLEALRADAVAQGRVDAYYSSLLAEKRQRLAETPEDPKVHYELGLTMLLLGGDDPAAQRGAGVEHQLRMAVRTEPGEPCFAVALATFLAASAERPVRDEAIVVLDAALQQRPTDAGLRVEKARLLAARPGGAEHERMTTLCREALSLAPGLGEAHFALGRAAVVRDRLDEARDHFERGLRLAPFAEGAHEVRQMLKDFPAKKA